MVVANLIAHDDAALADEFNARMRDQESCEELIARFDAMKQDMQLFRYVDGNELTVDGFAGLQYRAFFSSLLTTYAMIEVPGADRIMEEISESPQRSEAVRLLDSLYNDPEFITSLPIEL